MSARDAEFTLRVLERVRDVPAATWDALLREESSPFVEHAWLDMLEETGCVGEDTGWMPAHLSLWRGNALVAVAPSYVKGQSEGEFVFDWNWADLAERMGTRYYPKVVVAVPFTPATGDRVLVAPGEDRALATRLVAGAAREWCGRFKGGGVHVLFPRDEPELADGRSAALPQPGRNLEDGASPWEQAGYLRREGFQYHWFRHGATTFEDHLARFNSKHRNQVKRELRVVREHGITVETLAPEAHTRELARVMHGFYASTIERHGRWGRLYLNRDFFDAVVERFRDRLAWVVARDDRTGQPVAGAFNVAKGRRLYGRYWGARVEVPHLHFVVCYYAGIRYCVEHGLDVFEPGAGGEHKRARGFVPTLTRSFHWLADARMRSVIGSHLERERAAVRKHVAEEGGAGGGDLTDP